MAELFASGRIVDSIVVLMVLEYGLLIALRRRSRRGLSTGALLANLASGFALLMALRASLVGSPWSIVAVWLLLALFAHGVDLRIRWA